MSTLQAALEYAAAGLAVIPLWPHSKRPMTRRGVHDATHDPATIKAWFAECATANLGIATGPISGIWVLDVDPRNGGWSTLADLEFTHGPLEAACVQSTAQGGEHYVFKLSDNQKLRSKLGDGIDLLGDSRYFVAFPSVTPTGTYRWLMGHPSDTGPAPEWLNGLVARPDELPATPAMPPRQPSAMDMTRIQRYLEAIPGAIAGQGGHAHTFLVACKLVHGWGLDDDLAMQVMSEWNAKCQPPWSRWELARKIKSARSTGKYRRSL